MQFVVLLVPVGFLISAPAFFIYRLLFRWLMNDQLSDNISKSLLSLTAITGMVVTFYCLGVHRYGDEVSLLFMGSYAASIVAFSFAFRLRKNPVTNV